MSFIKDLQATIDRESLLVRGDRVVLGVSGGPDSMALLHGLRELNESADLGLGLHVAHLDHGLRGEASTREAEFVRTVCEKTSLPCTIESTDVRKVQEEAKGSPEEVARRERYAFFERVCLRTGSSVIATAHHVDDNAETILHRFARGTGLRGLSGIAPSRPWRFGSEIRLVRPLLFHRKNVLREYLEKNGYASCEDDSNESMEHTRNRIRKRILPLLIEEINPQAVDAIVRLGEQARWLQTYLHETAERQLESLIVHQTDQELVLNARALAQKRQIIATELIRQAVLRFQLGEQDLNFGHMMSVLDLASPQSGDRQTTGKQLHLPGGLTVTREYDRLHFSLPTDEPRENLASEVMVHVPGQTRLPVRRMEIHTALLDGGLSDLRTFRKNKPVEREWVDYDQIRPPLLVRARRPGDRFWPMGASGSKKVSDFFIDRKISAGQRQGVAILCDQLGPIWVVPFRIDERVKVTRATRRLLQLELKQW